MTLDEKLAHFKECAINDANKQGEAILNECKSKIQQQFDEYEKEARTKSEKKFKIESANLLKEKNKALSKSSLEIRRKVNDRAEELKDLLFEDVAKKISDYKKSKEYKKLLTTMINSCYKYANKKELKLYIDKSDKDLQSYLENTCKVTIAISERDIKGGILGVCEEKNLLIDNSFASKFAHEKSTFTF